VQTAAGFNRPGPAPSSLGGHGARDRPAIERFNSKGVVTGGGIPAVRRMRGRTGQMGWGAGRQRPVTSASGARPGGGAPAGE
jgi:hypothetical protein